MEEAQVRVGEIKSRPAPPRMDRRWLVLSIYGTPTSEETRRILEAVEIVDCAGLAAEVQRIRSTTYVYAARRRKNNGRVED